MSKRHDSLLFMVLYREALDRLCSFEHVSCYHLGSVLWVWDRAVRRRRHAAAAAIFVTPPPPVIMDQRAAAPPPTVCRWRAGAAYCRCIHSMRFGVSAGSTSALIMPGLISVCWCHGRQRTRAPPRLCLQSSHHLFCGTPHSEPEVHCRYKYRP